MAYSRRFDLVQRSFEADTVLFRALLLRAPAPQTLILFQSELYTTDYVRVLPLRRAPDSWLSFRHDRGDVLLGGKQMGRKRGAGTYSPGIRFIRVVLTLSAYRAVRARRVSWRGRTMRTARVWDGMLEVSQVFVLVTRKLTCR